ncbi:MAG: gamma carbonic anhydrase family protein [Calditrichaeota bacterium]|nr:gamma carbonic anhydrase family protein [Calditrichota bacterium]
MDFHLKDDIDIHPTAYIAPSARIYGKVKIGAYSSVWDGVIIRGDMAPIRIGDETSIQENSVIHVDTDVPTTIGSHVTVGHAAVVHGATVGDNCIIAIRSVLLNNSVIGNDSIIGAGAIVMEGTSIPAGSVVFGIPAKVAKPVSEEMKKGIRENADIYVKLGQAYLKKQPASQ